LLFATLLKRDSLLKLLRWMGLVWGWQRADSETDFHLWKKIYLLFLCSEV